MASRELIQGRVTTGGAALLCLAVIAALLAGTPAHAKRGNEDTRGGGRVHASIQFEIADSVEGLPETPGSDGLVYVVAGQDFGAALTFVDKRGEPSPLSTSEETKVTLSYVVPGAHAEQLASLTLPAGQSTVSTGPDALVIGNAFSGIVLRASAPTKHGTVVADSAPFDVLIESVSASSSDEVLTVGGDETGERGDCNPTEQLPVCGDLIQSPDFSIGALLSQGCLNNEDCTGSPTFIQAVAAFEVEDKSARAPGTLIMSCDKSVCGRGAIKNQTLAVTLSPNPQSAFAGEIEASACEAKGVVTYDPGLAYSTDNAPFCVDYVQSKRDIAGDTLLYLLFTVDAKVRFP